MAKRLGVDHIVKLTNNKGLAYAFQAGLDACLKLGADVIVNTDADNQYSADDIPALVGPILAGNADMVIGDRDVMGIEEFSMVKKRLQQAGSWVVRQASGTSVPDATSGFRAYNREAALGLTVVSRFTYTLESLIQAGKSLVAVDHVVVGTNEKLRESRLFGSMWGYVRRNVVAIFRIYAGYEPLKVFSWLAFGLLVASFLAWSPLLWDWIVNGDRSGHLQSIVVGGALLVAAVQVFALGVIADLIAAHRTVSQRTLERVRRLELELGRGALALRARSGAGPPPSALRIRPQEGVEHALGGRRRRHLARRHGLLELRGQTADVGMVPQALPERVRDLAPHPGRALLRPQLVEAVRPEALVARHQGVPERGDAVARERRAGGHRDLPARALRAQEPYRVAPARRRPGGRPARDRRRPCSRR